MSAAEILDQKIHWGSLVNLGSKRFRETSSPVDGNIVRDELVSVSEIRFPKKIVYRIKPRS